MQRASAKHVVLQLYVHTCNLDTFQIMRGYKHNCIYTYRNRAYIYTHRVSTCFKILAVLLTLHNQLCTIDCYNYHTIYSQLVSGTQVVYNFIVYFFANHKVIVIFNITNLIRSTVYLVIMTPCVYNYICAYAHNYTIVHLYYECYYFMSTLSTYLRAIFLFKYRQ